MDEEEAWGLAEAKLAQLRGLDYSSLAERFVGKQERLAATGDSGAKYQLEVQGLWDSSEGENVRIIVAIDDFSLRRFMKPLSLDFIIAPDGSFIGE